VYVNYLMDDLRDGIILLKVIDHFRPGLVDWKKVSRKNNRIFIIQNCNYVVDICRDKLGSVLVGVGGVDIVDGSITLTLGVVWQLCKLYWEERVGKINEEKLVAWANERVPEEHRVKNFKDKSLRNCMLLLHIIDSVKANTVDFGKVPGGDSEEDQISKINYTISCARKLGCEIIALWEHVNEANAKYVSLFVAELEHRSRKPK
jgi:plastin-1